MTNYSLASSSWDSAELDAIRAVIDSGRFSMGPFVEEYERAFAEYFGSKYSVMTSSGSTANLLMVAALFYVSDEKKRLKRGDEVIVPAVSWSTTYFPLQQYGLKVKFVDIDIETLNFDLDALQDAVTDKTRLVMAVNLLGNPNDFTRISEILAGKNIQLIEDNCESMGARFDGRHCGTFGAMGSFSSFFSHHISTMEGGAILTDSEELHHILLCLRAHGWTRNLPKKNWVSGVKSDNPFEESFNFVLPGYNVRPLEMSGAIGIEQLKKLPEFIQTRRKNAEHFLSLFRDDKLFYVQSEISESSWFGFSLILRPGAEASRSEVLDLLDQAGIENRPIVTGNFVKNKVLEYFDYEVHSELRNANHLEHNGLFVGNHHVDIRPQIDMLARLFT